MTQPIFDNHDNLFPYFVDLLCSAENTILFHGNSYHIAPFRANA